MKRTDLEKAKALALEERMRKAGTPDRFGKQAGEARSRREQREQDRAQGLVPFAVKLDGELVKRLQTLAQESNLTLGELTSELLRKGLGK